MVNKDVEAGKVCAILSYFFVGIIWYFADAKMKKNKFANFHTKQALVLLIIDVVLWILMNIIRSLGIIWTLLYIGLLVVWIFGLIYSINGQTKEVPVVGQFAKNFKF